jgi:MoaA/NifB/PqqE/SkfB family radical SAM enzyme
MDRVDRLDKTILATLTGGEVFLIKNFIEFVEVFTKKHIVRVDTNLSLEKECLQFIERIDPARVYEISFSVHAGERERRGIKLDDVSLLAKKFNDRGFRIVGNYVAFPPHLKRLRDDIKIFQDNGIEILPSLYVGRFDGKEYPVYKGRYGYSDDELDLILEYNKHAKVTLEHEKGQCCQAGISSFYINPDYQVYPCNTINTKLGSFWGEWKKLPKVLQCQEEFCYSPFYTKGFKSNPDDSMPKSLLQKAIKERGIASKIESRIMTGNFVKTIKSILFPVLDFFALRGVYFKVKQFVNKK